MKTSIELRQERTAVLARGRQILDAAEGESRDLTTEEQTNWDTVTKEVTSINESIKRQEFLEEHVPADGERRAWDLKNDERTDPKTPEEEAARHKRAYAEAFREYVHAADPKLITPQTWQTLHSGRSGISGDELRTLEGKLSPAQMGQLRAMGIGSQVAGGFWVPDEAYQPIEEAMKWYGGMRAAARVVPTDSGADLPWPVYDDTANPGRRLAESAAATKTDINVGVRIMKAFMYTSDEVLVSLQLLQDVPDIADAFMAHALGVRIARIQNTEFTTYDAADGPQGLSIGLALQSAGVSAAATGAVAADELRNLKYSVDRIYRIDGRYMMNDQTLRDIMGLKDGQGRYLFMDNPNSGDEPNIWGDPVVVNNDVPVMATTVRSVFYGDFDHYIIRDVRGFTLLRMDERYAPNLQVSFLAFARADGAYINAGQNPIKHLVQA